MEAKVTSLGALHAEVDARTRAIREENPEWLCGKGCDGCCHQLAEVPRLTSVEWELLQAGLAVLTLDQLHEIGVKISELANQAYAPIICPLLDTKQGTCMVYAQRPVACRTYGFYRQRDMGLYCKDIENRVAQGDWAEVVWGNQDTIDRRLSCLGDTRALTEWFLL